MIKRRRYGKEFKFRVMEHEPTNEQAVIVLFALVAEDLGFRIVDVRPGYPDAELKRVHKDGSSENFECEFEFKSSSFKEHEREPKCDYVVCWQDDWEECPVEVIELSSVIERVRARDRQKIPTQFQESKAGADTVKETFRKRPEIVYPDGYESIRESAKRLARMLTENEDNIYAQLWRKRHSLPLKKDSFGVLERGPKGSHLIVEQSDDELTTMWNDLKPTRPPVADSEHLSIAQASLELGFRTRGALGRKVRRKELGWEPDCKIHQYCYTRKRIEEIKSAFELCSNEEKKALLSPKQVKEVFEELGIKKDRHAVVKYTNKKQLRYSGKSPGQVSSGLQYYYHPDDLVDFIKHNFERFSKDIKPIEEAINRVRLRHEPLYHQE